MDFKHRLQHMADIFVSQLHRIGHMHIEEDIWPSVHVEEMAVAAAALNTAMPEQQASQIWPPAEPH